MYTLLYIPPLLVGFLDDVEAQPHYSHSAKHDDCPVGSSVWEMTGESEGLVASLGRHILLVFHSSHDAKQNTHRSNSNYTAPPRHVTFTWADLGESSDFGPVNRVVDVQEQRQRSLLSNWTGTLPEDDYPRVKVMDYKKRGGYESLKW